MTWGRVKAWLAARWKWLAIAGAIVLAVLKAVFSRKESPAPSPVPRPDPADVIHAAETSVRAGAADTRAAEVAAGKSSAEAAAAGKLDAEERALSAATPGATASADAANAYADSVRRRAP